mmetsp:Transcript_29318/g.33613  ORF Transcript_29318/g.33613 Transcript_29318/m.33613 type:complete len:100 (-) Transcript_29318:902-1201(-)
MRQIHAGSVSGSAGSRQRPRWDDFERRACLLRGTQCQAVCDALGEFELAGATMPERGDGRGLRDVQEIVRGRELARFGQRHVAAGPKRPRIPGLPNLSR